jgi:riboflavin kinase/FMN adenylyltransferase
MHIEQELAKLSPGEDTLLTVGVFDGVHLGHKYIISQLKELARQQNLLSGVVTFRQHPQAVLSPQTKLPFLTDLSQRINRLKNEGVEAVITLSFTRELAQLSARQFVNLLKEYLRMQGLVIGYDFALGRNREGNGNTLRALGQDMNFSVTVVPPLIINDEVVSSTAIRNALADGDMKRAHQLSGYFFSLHGPVVTGARRGIELGFPTANLAVNSEQALPADGVYATWAYINDQAYPSMTNIGRRPTFGDSQRTVEVYVLDYHGDLYERQMKIDIIERLRGEKKFGTAEELKRQIAEDIKQGRAILDSQGGN